MNDATFKIRIPKHELEVARARCVRENKSMAQLIRELLAEDVNSPAKTPRIKKTHAAALPDGVTTAAKITAPLRCAGCSDLVSRHYNGVGRCQVASCPCECVT